MSLMTGLFNVLALLYIGRAVQLAARIIQNRATLRQEPLTREKQRLAEQAAFFLGVPPAVFIHELAHALAIVVFGGQVAEFGYRVFWGYVVPSGTFTAVQSWIIAVAGTLGSLIFGLFVWILLRRSSSRTVQYFGLRTFRFQVYFSLIYYPIFTLFLSVGDWRTIYNFAATPVLSAATAVAHVLLLFLFWRADQAGFFDMVAFDSPGAQLRYESTRAAAETGDPMARLQTISFLWAGGARHEARKQLDDFLKDFPTSAEAQLQLAIMAGDGSRQVNKKAYDAAGQALALGLRGVDQIALARQIRALYHLERGQGVEAEVELNAAFIPTAAYDPEDITPIRRAELHRLRSQAYRRQGRYEDAYAEIDVTLQLARRFALESVVRECVEEKELIEKHAGRSMSEPTKRMT